MELCVSTWGMQLSNNTNEMVFNICLLLIHDMAWDGLKSEDRLRVTRQEVKATDGLDVNRQRLR